MQNMTHVEEIMQIMEHYKNKEQLLLKRSDLLMTKSYYKKELKYQKPQWKGTHL